MSIADMAEAARTGEPRSFFGCIACGRTPADGVLTYYREVRTPKAGREKGHTGMLQTRDEVIDYQHDVVCPCCSFKGCLHPKRSPLCRWCGRPMEPGWATQCAGHPGLAGSGSSG